MKLWLTAKCGAVDGNPSLATDDAWLKRAVNLQIEGDSVKNNKGRNALLAVGVGSFIAGTLSLLLACMQSGWDIPLAIAGGLIGDKAGNGGVANYLLGTTLHFFITFSVAAIYYAASRRLLFMTQYPLLCGLYFGATVRLVMNFIVLPLSALHATDPIPIRDFWSGLLEKMIVVGLPIAYSVQRFANPTQTSKSGESEDDLSKQPQLFSQTD